VSANAPQFDLAKFYRARCTSRELGSLFGTLRKVDEVMKARRATHQRQTLFFLLALVVAFAGLGIRDIRWFHVAALLSVLALVLLFVVGMLRMVFGPRTSTATRFLGLFLLLNPGVFIYLGVYKYFHVAASLLTVEVPARAATGVVLSTAVLVFVLRLIFGVRWAKVIPQAVELDYVEQITQPLLADLAKKARADLVFNPFRGEWSRIELPAPKRPGYTFTSTADILLRMRLPLDAQRTFKLSIVEYVVTKTKDRKSKYKGSKHALVVRYDMTLPGGASPAAPQLTMALAAQLAGRPGAAPSPSCATSVSVAEGRLTIFQTQKTSDQSRDLQSEHLVPVAQVLETIRFMSQVSLQPKS
jgi:hypothetical protein